MIRSAVSNHMSVGMIVFLRDTENGCFICLSDADQLLIEAIDGLLTFKILFDVDILVKRIDALPCIMSFIEAAVDGIIPAHRNSCVISCAVSDKAEGK